MTGRQKSDDRVVPEGRRKASRAEHARQGKAVTVSKQSEQLVLFGESADTSQEAAVATTSSPLGAERPAGPLSPNGKRSAPSPMSMEEIVDETNLRKAFRKVAANRGAPGPDRQSIEEVRQDLDVCLRRLRRSLLDGSYQAGDIRRVWIPKASGGVRGLGIPNVIDRLVQQAVHQVLSPRYEKAFRDGSHGFRPGRSCHTAIQRAKQYVEEGHDWVVDIDLEKFFDQVNHDRLMSRLEQGITDRRVLALIRQMLRAKVVMPDGVVVANKQGTPQGGPLSPLLSNIVLDELDEELVQRGHCYVRYADDCNIYVQSERSGQRVMASLKRFIENRLKLRVNVEKSRVAKIDERSFLGFTLRRLKTGKVYVLVSDAALRRLKDTVKVMTPRNWGRSFMTCVQRLNRYLRGWLGYFAMCDQKQHAHLGRVDGHLRRRLRALLLKQWKRKRHIVNRLIRLGVPVPMARVDIYVRRRNWWALSEVRAVHRGLNNVFFERCALFSLHVHWRKHHDRIERVGQKQPRLQVGALR